MKPSRPSLLRLRLARALAAFRRVQPSPALQAKLQAAIARAGRVAQPLTAAWIGIAMAWGAASWPDLVALAA